MATEKVEDTNTEEAELEVKEAEAPEETKPEDGEETDGEETVSVSIAGVSPAPEDEDAVDTPVWVKDLRARYKETTKQNRELTERIKKLEAPANKAEEVGPKPTLESCDYDGEKFEKELLTWQEKKRAADAEAQSKAKEVEDLENAYKKRQQDYETAKGNLKVKDFPEAEDTVKGVFSLMQQAIIVKGATNSAIVIYALGKNPDKAKELAAIKDPVEFAFAVARLEGQLKVTTKKAPAPEKIVSGSNGATKQGGKDATLERLRAEAEKTGNYTQVVAYKNKLKAK